MAPDDNDRNKIALDALLAETRRLGDAISERHAAAERFVAVAGTVLGVGLTLGLAQKQEKVLIGLPVAVIIIIIYMIQIYTDAGMHSGHRRALEERIEAEFGRPVLVGQTHVAAGHARRRSVRWTMYLFVGVWGLTVLAGGWAVLRLWPQWYVDAIALTGYLVVLVGLPVLVLGRAVAENQEAEEHARVAAMSAWEAPGAGTDE